MNKNKIIFESENIYYVLLDKNLINDYLIMVNDKEVRKYISHNDKTFTYEEEVSWVDDCLKSDDIIFSMIEKETNEFIGNIEVRKKSPSYEFGICITKNKQDKHYGYESIKSFLNYLYKEKGINELYLNVFNFNKRAIHLYEKIGFKTLGEGKTKEDLYMAIKINEK